MADLRQVSKKKEEVKPDLPSNTQRRYEVKRAELPVHCPVPGTTLWDSHPRVYLPLEEHGHARCPYCGAEFVLKD